MRSRFGPGISGLGNRGFALREIRGRLPPNPQPCLDKSASRYQNMCHGGPSGWLGTIAAPGANTEAAVARDEVTRKSRPVNADNSPPPLASERSVPMFAGHSLVWVTLIPHFARLEMSLCAALVHRSGCVRTKRLIDAVGLAPQYQGS